MVSVKVWTPSPENQKVYMRGTFFFFKKRVIQLLWKSVWVRYRYIVGLSVTHQNWKKKREEGYGLPKLPKREPLHRCIGQENDPRKPTTWTETTNINFIDRKDVKIFHGSLSAIYLQKKNFHPRHQNFKTTQQFGVRTLSKICHLHVKDNFLARF